MTIRFGKTWTWVEEKSRWSNGGDMIRLFYDCDLNLDVAAVRFECGDVFAFYPETSTSILSKYCYETRNFPYARTLILAHHNPDLAAQMVQFMEDEETKPATPPPAAKPHAPNHCRYAGGVPIHPPRMIDSDHSYLVAEELRSLRSHLRRTMREWPVCPWGHTVQAGFKYDTPSGSPWDPNPKINASAVFYCKGCYPKFNGVLNLVKEEE
jgi:hypothetical protein